MKEPIEPTAKGFIHSQEKSRPVSKVPAEAFWRAIATKRPRTASWRPTRVYWTPLVAVMPR